jgi:hypothetical protein
MKIDNLIDRSFTSISVFKNMADVSEQILLQGYIAVEGDNSKILGIITLKDYHINQTAEILKSEIAKPHLRPDHTIYEVRELMKSSGSDYLPVYDTGTFMGVVSVGNITDRLIHVNKQTRLNYQKVIHDLRNPIANIQGIIEIISDAVSDPESKQMLELSIQSSEHAMEILEDLLFVELDENKPLVLQPTEMNQFFKECVNEQNGGLVNFLGSTYQANSFSNLNRKNATSVTPLKLALKFFILELKDSAFALVFLLLKKFIMLSKWCSREFKAVLNSSIFDFATLSFHFSNCSKAMLLRVFL